MTLMIDLEDVNHTSGKTMNGRTMERTAWEATRSVSMPERPEAAATMRAGIRPRQRVRNRRSIGYKETSR